MTARLPCWAPPGFCDSAIFRRASQKIMRRATSVPSTSPRGRRTRGGANQIRVGASGHPDLPAAMDEARQELDADIAANANSVEALHLAARLAISKYRERYQPAWMEAAQSYSAAAVALAPRNADVRTTEAYIIWVKGRTEDAIAGYSAAIALQPDHSIALDSVRSCTPRTAAMSWRSRITTRRLLPRRTIARCDTGVPRC